MTKYIAILASAWCNDSGCGIEYSSSLQMHDKRDQAIKEGFKLRDSDDFNIGVIEGGVLISLDWMNKVIESDQKKLAEIAEQICLEYAHD